MAHLIDLICLSIYLSIYQLRQITWQNVGGRVRESPKFGSPWEAVLSDWIRQIREPIREHGLPHGLTNFTEINKFLTFDSNSTSDSIRCANKKSRTYGTSDSFAKINLICQICQRVRSVRESNLWGRVGGRGRPSTASHHKVIWFESPIGLSRTAAESPILGAIWLISRLNALLRPESDLWGRSDSQICEAVGVRARPLTRKSCDLSESPIGLPRPSHGLTDLRVRSASHSWPAVRVRSSGQSQLYRAKQPDRPEDQTLMAGQPWEADRTLKSVRPWEAVCVRGHAPWLAQTDHMTNCVRPRGWEAVWGRKWEAVRGRVRAVLPWLARADL